MRLIDADAYAEEMKKRQDACMEAMESASYEGEQFSPKEHWEGVRAAFSEAKLTLDNMPTIGFIVIDDSMKLVWKSMDEFIDELVRKAINEKLKGDKNGR